MTQNVNNQKKESILSSFAGGIQAGANILGKTVSKSDGLVFAAKALISYLDVTKFFPGQTSLLPLIALRTELKSFTDLTGALGIFSRIKEWICPAEGEKVPFFLSEKTSGVKVTSKVLATAASICEVVKYAGSFALFRLPIPLAHIGIAKDFLTIGSAVFGAVENGAKFKASRLKGADVNEQINALQQKKNEMKDLIRNNTQKIFPEVLSELKQSEEWKNCKQELKNKKICKINNETEQNKCLFSLIGEVSKITVLSLVIFSVCLGITAMPFAIMMTTLGILSFSFAYFKFCYDETHKNPIPLPQPVCT